MAPSKSQRSSELPQGFDSISATVRMVEREFKEKSLFAALAAIKTLQVRSDNGSIRGVLRTATMLPRSHGHFEFRTAKRGSPAVIEIDLVPGTHTPKSKKSTGLDVCLALLQRQLPSPKAKRSTLLCASFRLSMKKWHPTIPLPIGPVGITEEVPGVPSICGVDLAFARQNGDHYLSRAFVTVFESIDLIVVRLLMRASVAWDRNLGRRMIEYTTAHLQTIVRPRD